MTETPSDQVLKLADEFIDRLQNGERPEIKEYVERYPQWAEEIREVFPTIELMEDVAQTPISRSTIDSTPNAIEHRNELKQASSIESSLGQLGEYRLIREIGRGGMGVVYEAEQSHAGRRVAVKVLLQKDCESQGIYERFQREATAAARLHHSNIVPVFSVGEEDGVPFYAMQLINGTNLHDLVTEIRRACHRPTLNQSDGTQTRSVGGGSPSSTHVVSLSDFQEPGVGSPKNWIFCPNWWNRKGRTAYFQNVARVALQLANALTYAHSRGMLHRDIKPANILVDCQGNAWVTDFGLVKVDGLQSMTATSEVLGTVRYLAPETFKGEWTEQSDLYSLGLAIYELLAIEPAFGETDRPRLLWQIMHENITPIAQRCADVPQDLATIVSKAVERDPTNRYNSAGEMAEDLQRFLNDEPIRARQVSLTEHLFRWVRRYPALASLMGVIATLLVAATVASLIVAGSFRRTEQDQRRLADENKELAEKAVAERNLAQEATETAQKALYKSQRTLSDMYRSFGIRAQEDETPHLAALWFAEAARIGSQDPRRKGANEIRAANALKQCPQPAFVLDNPDQILIDQIRFHPSNQWVTLRPE
ncbi:MAG: serine/threonine protein kinase, partial [Planctomycetaceae bacterium]|nr:serine/threonine protein kinase [Planctomycetaceae bacterium]